MKQLLGPSSRTVWIEGGSVGDGPGDIKQQQGAKCLVLITCQRHSSHMFEQKMYFLITCINLSLSGKVSEILPLLVLSTFSIEKGCCFLKAILQTQVYVFITLTCNHSTEGFGNIRSGFKPGWALQPKHLFQIIVPFLLQVWDFSSTTHFFLSFSPPAPPPQGDFRNV